MTTLPQTINSDTMQPSASPFKGHEYDVPYCFQAKYVERKTKNGLTVYEFTNGTSFTLTLHSTYDKHAYDTMPESIKDIPPQVRTDCALDLFWCWRRPTGAMKFDAMRVIDMHQTSNHVPGQNATKRREDMKKAACKAAVENVKDFRNERDYWWQGDTNDYDKEQAMPQGKEETMPTLEDELTTVANQQATQDKPTIITDEMIEQHELDPKRIRHAIPGHLDNTYGKGKGGLHVRHIFGAKGFDAWYNEHQEDSRLAWRLTLQYELKNPPAPALKDDDDKKGQETPVKQSEPQNDSKKNVAPQTLPQKSINSGIQVNEGKVATNIIKLDEAQIRAKYTKKLQGGKEYLEVAGRVLLFRLDHPAESGWTIDTDLVQADDTGCIFKARVSNPDGHTVSTGHARATTEGSRNFGGRIFEKAETAAIGRALAHAGYGTDDVEEADDSESPAHLADTPRKIS